MFDSLIKKKKFGEELEEDLSKERDAVIKEY